MLVDLTHAGPPNVMPGEESRLTVDVDCNGVKSEGWLATLDDDIEGVRSCRLFGFPS